MNDSEVIAVKSRNSRLYLLICVTVVLVVCLALLICIPIFAYNDGVFEEQFSTAELVFGIVIMVIAAGAIVFSVCECVRYVRFPNVIITREGDKLNFLGRIFAISDIAHIEYGGNCSQTVPIGYLRIHLNDGSTLKCKYISNPYAVYLKLLDLKKQNNVPGESANREES